MQELSFDQIEHVSGGASVKEVGATLGGWIGEAVNAVERAWKWVQCTPEEMVWLSGS